MKPIKFLTKCSKQHTLKTHSTITESSRMKCANTSHGSNPTLIRPVNGLHSIIQNRWTSVLRGRSGPTDEPVGMGRLHFDSAEVY